jgi:putative ABC transport system permease protein
MSLWQDLRIGARMLAKKPGFTAIVVLALALGLGVSGVVFSVVNAVLLRPLAIRDPGGLISIQRQAAAEVDLAPRSQFAFPDYLVLRDDNQAFDGVIASHFDQYAFGTGQGVARGPGAEFLGGELVSGNYFQVLGVPAQLGRTFSPAEGDNPAADPVIVLSDAVWRRRFAADPSVLGRKVTLNDHALTVIGVMPPGFTGSLWVSGIDYWYPLAVKPRIEPGNDGWIHDRSRREVSVLARLRPGVTLAQARARVEVLGQNLARQFPLTNANVGLRAVSEIEGRYGDSYGSIKRGALLALLMAGLIMLICCANVANLLLARAAGRTKELGIRLALGAGRIRIVRQLMTESLLLALMGGALGLVVAAWLPQLLHAFLPPLPFDPQRDLSLDPAVIAWTLVAAVLAGIVFGSLPAWRASQGDLVTALKTDLGAEGQRFRRGGLRQALVVAQIAISVVVVLTGGLIVRSLQKLEAVDPGYRLDTLVSAQLNPGLFLDFGSADHPQLQAYFQELTRRLEKVPGVKAVSSSAYMPLVNFSAPRGPIVREGEAPPPPNQGLTTGFSLVYRNYFQVIGTELLRGRDFEPQERVGVPGTVIVNAELARRLFGGPEEAMGKRFRIGGPEAPFLRIVGVARDGRYRSLGEEPASWVYLPGCAPGLDCGDLTDRAMLVRAASVRDLPAVAAAFRAEATSLDPRIPIEALSVGQTHLAAQLYQSRLAAEMGLVLALLALALAALGLYSVMTYAVSQRTKEIGIRMALGGQVRDVLRLVLKQGLGLTAVGVALGMVFALVVAHLLATFLYGIQGADPLTLAATMAVLIVVALLAIVFPARRAAKVSPMVAIRYDQQS